MIAVEWSEDQQAFHKNCGKPENTNGFRTLAKFQEHITADSLIKLLTNLIIYKRTNVTFDEMKKATDIMFKATKMN